MKEITVKAHAKINLSLDVLRKRPDGYHDLMTVMQTVGLSDTINIRIVERPVFKIRTNRPFLPHDTRNLALAAAKLFLTRSGNAELGAEIELDKKIPICGGLGGGSSDAAAVLRALSGVFPAVGRSGLLDMALELGSDVPFCLLGGTMLAEGRGESLTELNPIPDCFIVLSKPDIHVSTKWAFSGVDVFRIKRRPDTKSILDAIEKHDLPKMARYMYNVFEDPLTAEHRQIASIRAILIEKGALGAVLSGTGPTVFGVFDKESAAAEARSALLPDYPDTFMAPCVHSENL